MNLYCVNERKIDSFGNVVPCRICVGDKHIAEMFMDMFNGHHSRPITKILTALSVTRSPGIMAKLLRNYMESKLNAYLQNIASCEKIKQLKLSIHSS